MDRVRTLVVSDLHLGGRSGKDLLSEEEPLRALLAEVERADRLVLLGDVLELRGLPAAEALDRARPVLDRIGETAGGSEVILVPGNHDHALGGEVLGRIRQRSPRSGLGLEQLEEPAPSSLAALVAEAMRSAELRLAYPGVWLRRDVYAIHGHYLDCHNTVPAMEALAAAATARLAGGLPEGGLSPDDYESVLRPIYAFVHELSQGLDEGRRASGGGASLRIWQRLSPHDGRLRPSRLLLGGVAIPGAVAALNRAGLGPFSADLSPAALRRAALRGMGTVVERLGVAAEHVIFGHTHRAGPLGADHDGDGWRRPDGGRLWNSGSWVYEPALIGPAGAASGHWPGACIVVDETGPPRIERLLQDLPAAGLSKP